MAQVTAQLVKELRERTQAGMSDCKNALVEAEGDMDKAVEVILKKGLAKTAKRASAVATEGDIRTWVSPDAKYGVMIEVNIQTDFAARNEKFVGFVDAVLEVAKSARAGDDLTAAKYPGGDKTVAQVRDELIATIGEKIDVRRFTRIDLGAKAGAVHAYRHMNGKIGVLLEAATETPEVAKHEAFLKYIDDTTMQAAAMSPQYLDRTQVSEDDVAKQREIFAAQLKEDPKPKPEAAWPKIIEGKLNKWFSEICLIDQDSVQESQKTVEMRRAEASKAAGGNIKLVRFARYERGEGLAKKVDDFAEEARKMAGG
jgi:elongation factor Ts